MADTPDLGSGVREDVQVQLLLDARITEYCGGLAQRQEADPLKGLQCGFESRNRYVDWTPENRRGYMVDYYTERRNEYIAYLGGHCVRCGSTKDLEFDHVYWQEKTFSVMDNWSAKEQGAVYAELDKCQLLCPEHHKHKTKQDKAEMSYYRPISHGTVYAWMKLKCKCDVCNEQRDNFNTRRKIERRNKS